jgi:hypothetical protein
MRHPDSHPAQRSRNRPAGARRRAPFLGTTPPPSIRPACWEIHREKVRGADEFGIYLDGQRIGSERGAAELRELLVGARLRADDANRVIATLGTSSVVWIEVRPPEATPYRRPASSARP